MAAAGKPAAAAVGGAGTAVAVGGAGTMPAGGSGDKQENVKVAIRVRPFNKREKELKATKVVEVAADGKTMVITDPSKAGKGADAAKTFTFDFAYDWDTAQSTVYADLAKPIVDQALRGYNGTIFAYGQTGSGKTFSMMGDDSNPGIIPLMNGDLFSRIDSLVTDSRKFMVIVSYLEIYNEVVKDLLNPSDKQLTIREHPEMGIYVQDLAELVVKSSADVVKLLEQGQKVRHVAATAMNERSSRSHSCFTLKIEQKTTELLVDKQKTTTLTAKINLVDLAGSERAAKTGATGDVLKQGAAINKSLSALGNVINALAEGSKFVPYRDSKLTRLLQHSLGGNSLTVMIAAASPADDNFDETLSTLQYANRAKNIKNDAKRNEDVNELLIRQLREEIEGLRKALAMAQGGAAGAASGGDTAGTLSEAQQRRMEEMIANLERAKQQSWDEKQRMSALYEDERTRNLANETKIRSVMQTIKEDNKELMKRMRHLVTERNRLTKLFKQLKDQHIATREALAAEMAAYQELHADGGEDGPHKEELEEIIGEIEKLHAQVESEAAELKAVKDEIADNEQEQLEARSEAAAQRMLLEEDAELRKAIQEEERAKLEKQNEALIEAKLEEERKRLKDDADRERAALLAKFAASHSSEREHELELKLIEANSDKSMLVLELSEMKLRHEAEIKRLTQEHKKAIHAMKVEELRMFREMCDGVEEEKAAMDAKLAEAGALLRDAVADITALQEQNAELQRQLLIAAAWEPDTR